MRSVHPHWLANLRGAGRGDAGLRLRPLAVVAGAVAALLVGFVAPAAAGAGYHYDAAAAHVAAGTTAGHGGVVAAGPAAAAVGADAAGVQLRLTVDGVAPRSPHIDPADVAHHTPQQIDDLATDAGLIPRGPDPQSGLGSYIDPVTGQQRVLCHPGACPPHAHVNDPLGNRLDINGNIVSPESPAAHLPLTTGTTP